MATLAFDDELRAKLGIVPEPTELCDADGNPVAYILSAEQYRRLITEWLKTQFADADAERAWQDYQRSGGVSTREAWHRVEQRLQASEGAA